MTVLYLSGPMRGIPDLNFPAFNAAAKALRNMGYTVINPAETGDPAHPRAQLMGQDLLDILQQCDGVACLPNWQHSPGANAEVGTAFATDKPVYDVVQTGNTFMLIPSQCTAVTIPRELQYKNKIPLIGLCGFAQSGKDTVAGFLVEQGWTRVAFADKLREVLYALDPWVNTPLARPRRRAAAWRTWLRTRTRRDGFSAGPVASPLQQIVDDVGWDVAKVKYQDIRRLLQRLGTEAGREIIDDNLWVGLGEQQIEAAGGPVVVTDARFPNELQLIRRRGGILCWIERDGVAAVNSHASEHSVSKDDCEYTIYNNFDLDRLREQVDLLLTTSGIKGALV